MLIFDAGVAVERSPFWTTGKAAQRLGVAYTTAQRAIERLEATDILAQVGKARRDRVYCARRIMDVLDEPPKLTP